MPEMESVEEQLTRAQVISNENIGTALIVLITLSNSR